VQLKDIFNSLFYRNPPKKELVKKVIASNKEIKAIIANEGITNLIERACQQTDCMHIHEKFVESIKPAAILLVNQAPIQSCTLGSNKIGGAPDVPTSFKWPRFQENELTFFLQVNCEDLPELNLGLPKKGILSFYYYLDPQLENSLPNNSGVAQVFHFHKENLVQMHPSSSTIKYPERQLDIINFISFPPQYNFYNFELLNDVSLDKYTDEFAEITYCLDKITKLNNAVYHQIGGYPEAVQGHNIEILTAQKKIGTKVFSSEFEDETLTLARKQKLLLQINGINDPVLDLIGKIYYIVENGTSHKSANAWNTFDF
jgi:uncharacterized protein YwqG